MGVPPPPVRVLHAAHTLTLLQEERSLLYTSSQPRTRPQPCTQSIDTVTNNPANYLACTLLDLTA